MRQLSRVLLGPCKLTLKSTCYTGLVGKAVLWFGSWHLFLNCPALHDSGHVTEYHHLI